MAEPLRHDEPGYFVIVGEDGEEVAGSQRQVPPGFDHERDNRIVFALAMAASEGCIVVFKPKRG